MWTSHSLDMYLNTRCKLSPHIIIFIHFSIHMSDDEFTPIKQIGSRHAEMMEHAAVKRAKLRNDNELRRAKVREELEMKKELRRAQQREEAEMREKVKDEMKVNRFKSMIDERYAALILDSAEDSTQPPLDHARKVGLHREIRNLQTRMQSSGYAGPPYRSDAVATPPGPFIDMSQIEN